MRFSPFLFVLTIVFVFGFGACDLDGSGGSGGAPTDDPGSSPTSTAFSLDVTGAQALALGAAPDVGGNSVSARDIDASSVTNDTLLRVMVDGSIEEAISTENDGSTPPIQFIAIDPNGDVYISFVEGFFDSAIGLFHLDVESNVLTAVNAESFQLDEYGNGGNGVVKNWYWDSGLSRAKPIVFGSDGSAYFVLNTYDNSGWGTDRVYKWVPGSGAVAQPQTPDVSGMTIERFQVDNVGRMYAYGRLDGLNYAQFLQVFDPWATRGAYAFYSEGGSGYVRGYTVFGDRVYINGSGLYGGIDGIAEATTSVVDDAVEITPTTLYDSNSNDWFDPVYRTQLRAGEEIHEGLFRLEATTNQYVWADHWKTDSGALDGDRILEYVSRFFVEDVALHVDYSWNGEIGGTTDLSVQSYASSDVHNLDSMTWLRNHVAKAADSTQPASLFRDWRDANGFEWLNFSSVMDMIVIDQELWGIYEDGSGNPTALMRLVDSSGNRSLSAVRTRSGVGDPVKADLFQISQGRIYYRYKGDRPGTHRIASIDTAGTVRDITAQVTDIQYMTIYDYSIGAERIYFTGFDGIETVAGSIDLTDLSYRRLSSERLLSGIEVIR